MADSGSLDALVEALRRLPGWASSRPRAWLSTCCSMTATARSCFARPAAGLAQRTPLRALQHLHEAPSVQCLPRSRPRRNQAVRGRDRRPTRRRSSAPAPFAATTSSSWASSARSTASARRTSACEAVRRALRLGEVAEVIPGHQLHGRGEATAHVIGEALAPARPHGHAVGARRTRWQRTRIRRSRDHCARACRPALTLVDAADCLHRAVCEGFSHARSASWTLASLLEAAMPFSDRWEDFVLT
jgi:hypothetical protein